MKPLLIVLLLTGWALGQASTATTLQMQAAKQAAEKAAKDMPSAAEIAELLIKAGEKVAVFRMVVNSAKPQLDDTKPGLAAKYADTAATAETIIADLRANGPSGYGLVMLVAVLQNLSLHAEDASTRLLLLDELRVSRGQPSEYAALRPLPLLDAAGKECYDVSQLLLDATLRHVAAEETTLRMLILQNKH